MMADEAQPNTPSEGAEPADVAAAEPTSGESREGPSTHWWDRLLNKRPTPEAASDDKEQAEATVTSPQKLSLTQEELDRRVQAETDRREAQRAQRQRAEERKKLRDTDPWAYAEEERKAEQSQSQDTATLEFFRNVGTQHDRIAIDPLMESLPAAERQRIMDIEGAGRGLDGRKLVVNEALKSLEKHWKAEGAKDAEVKLRRNQAFRKQILSEARAGIVEPDLLPAYSSSEADQKVSDILRGYYGVGRHNSAG
jgi:hypothetical protein